MLRPRVSVDMPVIEEEASSQLQNELIQSIDRAATERRPVLTHLNADTTWLLSIPYPSIAEAPAGRCRYNVLIDPWLRGPQIDGAGWFSTQWHAVESSVQHVSEVETLLHDAESMELAALKLGSETQEKTTSYIDAVVVSHEFTDHCHKTTLLEVHPDTPVFATSKAAALISSWSHFKTVVDMALFKDMVDWRTTSTAPLPSWIGVSRLVTKSDALYYHSAVIICMASSNNSAEAVIYTPHGVEAPSLKLLNSAKPPVKTLAFMHGLHDVSLRFTKQLNLGAYNALQAQRILHSKYWVGTHDEVKKGGGIVASFIRRKAHTLMDAISHEVSTLSQDKIDDIEQLKRDAAFVDLGNGHSIVLV